jgi:hypothetical protein
MENTIKSYMSIDDIKVLLMQYYDEIFEEEDFYTGDIITFEEPQYNSKGTKSLYEIISYIFKNYTIHDYFIDNFTYFKKTRIFHEKFGYGYTFHTLKNCEFHEIVKEIYDFSLTLKF